MDKVKDEDDWTPLHHLAYQGKIEVLNHPSVDKVKDIYGKTPLDFLAKRTGIPKEKYLKDIQMKNISNILPTHSKPKIELD